MPLAARWILFCRAKAACISACVTQGTPNAATMNATDAAFSPPSMLPFPGRVVPRGLRAGQPQRSVPGTAAAQPALHHSFCATQHPASEWSATAVKGEPYPDLRRSSQHLVRLLHRAWHVQRLVCKQLHPSIGSLTAMHSTCDTQALVDGAPGGYQPLNTSIVALAGTQVSSLLS